MTERFKAFMPFIIKWEGSAYENDPDDPGGETKYGIDKRSHPNEDIRNMTEDRARVIYFTEYWSPLHCDQLPAKVGEIVMDIGVNNGKSRSVRWLQQLLGVAQDGVIGSQTISAATKSNAPKLAVMLLDHRELFYRSIAKGRMAKFLKGWLNRNEDLRRWVA